MAPSDIIENQSESAVNITILTMTIVTVALIIAIPIVVVPSLIPVYLGDAGAGITPVKTCKCSSVENKIYQVTVTLPGLQPFYGLLTLLSNCMFFEDNNIANGQNAAQFGANISFGTHAGYYECRAGKIVHLTDIGYVYKSTSLSVLTGNGAIALHDYYLTFSSNDYTSCTGKMQSAFYSTGTNPFQVTNTPILSGPTATVTCQLLNGRN